MLTKIDLYQESLELFLESPEFVDMVYKGSWLGQYNYVALGLTDDHEPYWHMVEAMSYDNVNVAKFEPELRELEFAIRVPFLRRDKYYRKPNRTGFESKFDFEIRLIKDYLRSKVERSLAPFIKLSSS